MRWSNKAIEGSIRESLVVMEESTGLQYRFGMLGPEFQEHEWEQFLTALSDIDSAPDYLAASESLSPGVPTDLYARVACVGKDGCGFRQFPCRGHFSPECR